jgi:hypothetical protein
MKANVLYFKLVTGEHIISIIDSMDQEYILLHKPLQLFLQNTMGGASVRVAKWIPFTDENDFPLQVRHVLMKAKPTKDIIDYYFNALYRLNEIINTKEETQDFLEKDEEEITLAMFEKFSNTSIVVH